MRVSNEVVFDDAVEGTTAVYTSPTWNDTLGVANRFYVQAIVAQAAGTSPTLTVQAEVSGNERDWSNLAGTAEINAIALSATARTLSAVGSGSPTLGFLRFRIQLGSS